MGLEEGPRPYFRVVKGGSRGGVVNFIVRNTGRLGEEGKGGGGGGQLPGLRRLFDESQWCESLNSETRVLGCVGLKGAGRKARLLGNDKITGGVWPPGLPSLEMPTSLLGT